MGLNHLIPRNPKEPLGRRDLVLGLICEPRDRGWGADRALPHPSAPSPGVPGYMNSVDAYHMHEETSRQEPARPIFSPSPGLFTGYIESPQLLGASRGCTQGWVGKSVGWAPLGNIDAWEVEERVGDGQRERLKFGRASKA